MTPFKVVVRYFLRGCLVLTPLAITLYIIYWILHAIDQILPMGVPGAGLAITLALIAMVGFLTSNVVGRTALELTERGLTRLPLVKLIYTSIKDLVRAFVGDKKSFDRPVVVSMEPGGATKLLGFVTRDRLNQLGLPEHVAVYFPQSYNFAGYLAMIPRAQVEALAVSSAELMTFIVSGGVSGFGVGQSLMPPDNRSASA